LGKEAEGAVPEPRKGQDDVHLTREEFTSRYRQSFYDPAFDGLQQEIERLAAAAWDGYEHSRKSPRTRKAGISGSARNDQTCSGEMPKSYRLLKLAQEVLRAERIEVDCLDLSQLDGQYGRRILPCKACVSTAMPLCHWPCSCYPNHSLGQVNDWMNELYPRFVAAHGIMIITPVCWYSWVELSVVDSTAAPVAVPASPTAHAHLAEQRDPSCWA
jgi:hypothetical protein